MQRRLPLAQPKGPVLWVHVLPRAGAVIAELEPAGRFHVYAPAWTAHAKLDFRFGKLVWEERVIERVFLTLTERETLETPTLALGVKIDPSWWR